VDDPVLFGAYGSGALDFASRFREYGANAIWFHGFDPAAFDTCAAYGILPCVEFKTFRADFNRYPQLVPIGVDGKPIRYGELVQGVCLSQKDFLEETESHLLAGLQQFSPTGIWLDYLTYAGWFETPTPDLQESCFCPACIADFCQHTGLDAETPTQILGTAQAAWTRHKCQRIAALAQRNASLIRTHRPGCLVGAYMCPWTSAEFDGALRRIFAQDYALLAPAIDVFTPLIYVLKSGRHLDWGAEFLRQAAGFIPAGNKIQLILDVLDFPYSLQASAQADPPSWGIQLYGGRSVFADPDQSRIFAQSIERIRSSLA